MPRCAGCRPALSAAAGGFHWRPTAPFPYTSQKGGEGDVLRVGMHVRELTKKVGQTGRTGKVTKVKGDNVEVLWDDGHVSSLSGAVLQPVRKQKAG